MDDSLKCKLKLQIVRNGRGLGPGMIKIMELVEETHSLSAAYHIMGLSSSKGWRIMRYAEEDLGFKLLESMSGGAGGGITVLTPKGKAVLEAYKSMEKKLNDEAENLLSEFLKKFES